MLCAKCFDFVDVKDLYKVQDVSGVSFVCFKCAKDYVVIGKATDYKKEK